MNTKTNQIKEFKQPFQVMAFYGFLGDEKGPVIDYLGGYRLDKSRRRGKVLVTREDTAHIIADVLQIYKRQIDDEIYILCISDKDGKTIADVKHPGDFIDDDGNVRYEVDKTIN